MSCAAAAVDDASVVSLDASASSTLYSIGINAEDGDESGNTQRDGDIALC